MVEVISKIRTAEENAEEAKKLARRTAIQMKEDAASAGRRRLDEETRKAQLRSAELIEKAEALAAERLEDSHRESAALCDKLKTSAGAKTDEAAKFIVERIVDSL